MTEISEAAKLKACELANAEKPHDRPFVPTDTGYGTLDALARYIQTVSDAAKAAAKLVRPGIEREVVENALAPFILPDPVDPLVGVVEEAIAGTAEKGALQLREALAKRGLQIVPLS